MGNAEVGIFSRHSERVAKDFTWRNVARIKGLCPHGQNHVLGVFGEALIGGHGMREKRPVTPLNRVPYLDSDIGRVEFELDVHGHDSSGHCQIKILGIV